jgi:hypothetical protein
MTSIERLGDLPFDIRYYIANMDFETLMLMYIYDTEFRKHANNDLSLKKQVRVEKITNNYNCYYINNIMFAVWRSKHWYMDERLHKLHGPARTWSSGKIEYWQNGLRHRLDGPAVIYADGTEEYWQNGLLHRSDGPAIALLLYCAYLFASKLYDNMTSAC